MLLNHPGQLIGLRLVFTSATTGHAVPALASLGSILPEGTLTEATDDPPRVVFSFFPPGLGPVSGYLVHVTLVGMKEGDADHDPCALTGFPEVDGVLYFLGDDPASLAADAAGLARVRRSLEVMGYADRAVPIVAALRAGTALAALPAAELAAALPGTTIAALPDLSGSAVLGRTRELLRETLRAMGASRLRQLVVGPQGRARKPEPMLPGVPVRTMEERALYEHLNGCACGSREVVTTSGRVTAEGEDTLSIRGRTCRTCGATWTATYRIPASQISLDGLGPGPSRCIEAGEFLALADRWSRAAGTTVPLAEGLELAIDLIEQALALAGPEGISSHSFTTPLGEPHHAFAGRAGEERLRALLASFRARLAGLTSRYR
jgi:hypothetical protein